MRVIQVTINQLQNYLRLQIEHLNIYTVGEVISQTADIMKAGHDGRYWGGQWDCEHEDAAGQGHGPGQDKDTAGQAW